MGGRTSGLGGSGYFSGLSELVLGSESFFAISALQLGITVAPELRSINSRSFGDSPLCGVTVANLNRQPPFFKQPFGYITSVSVAHTPSLQFERRDIRFRNEVQKPYYVFELGWSCRNWPGWTAPTRISTAAHTFKIVLKRPLFPAPEEGKV